MYFYKQKSKQAKQQRRTWISKSGHIDRSSSTFFKTPESKVCPPNPGCTARTSTQCSSRRGSRRGNTTEIGVSGLRATPARMPALVICSAFLGYTDIRHPRGKGGGHNEVITTSREGGGSTHDFQPRFVRALYEQWAVVHREAWKTRVSSWDGIHLLHGGGGGELLLGWMTFALLVHSNRVPRWGWGVSERC